MSTELERIARLESRCRDLESRLASVSAREQATNDALTQMRRELAQGKVTVESPDYDRKMQELAQAVIRRLASMQRSYDILAEEVARLSNHADTRP